MGDLWLWFPHAEPLGKCLLVRSALHASLKHTQQALQVRPRVTNTPGISVWPWPAASSRFPFLTLTLHTTHNTHTTHTLHTHYTHYTHTTHTTHTHTHYTHYTHSLHTHNTNT